MTSWRKCLENEAATREHFGYLIDQPLAAAIRHALARVAESRRLKRELREARREIAGQWGTIDRLKRELREPCQRCEMRREQESRR